MTNEDVRIGLRRIQNRVDELTNSVNENELPLLLAKSIDILTDENEIVIFHLSEVVLTPLAYWKSKQLDVKLALLNLQNQQKDMSIMNYLIVHFRSGIAVGATIADAEDTIQFASTMPSSIWTKKGYDASYKLIDP